MTLVSMMRHREEGAKTYETEIKEINENAKHGMKKKYLFEKHFASLIDLKIVMSVKIGIPHNFYPFPPPRLVIFFCVFLIFYKRNFLKI